MNSFRIILLFLFVNAFLVTSKLPDGLFTAKELGLYFSSGLSCLLSGLTCYKRKAKLALQLHIFDLLTFGFLVLLPLSHFFIIQRISPSAVVSHISFGVLYFSIRVLASDMKIAELAYVFTEMLVIFLCFNLLIASAQYFRVISSYHPILGATGMFFNPGPFAIYMSASISFVFVIGLIRLLQKLYGWAIFYIFLLGLGLFFIALSLSRSAWIGLGLALFSSSIAVLFVYKETWFRRNWPTIRNYSAIALLLVIPAGSAIYEMKIDSAIGRELIWKSTALMIKDFWCVGVGMGNFASEYIHYQGAFLNMSPDNLESYGRLAGDPRFAFNDSLQTVAETGIVGISLFLGIVVYIFWVSIRFIFSGNAESDVGLLVCGGIACLTCILAASATAYPLQMVPIKVLFWLTIAVVISTLPLPKSTYKFNNSLVVLFFGFILTVTSGLSFYYFHIKTNSYLQWKMEEKKEIMDTNKLLSLYPLLYSSASYLQTIAYQYMVQGNYRKAQFYLEAAVKYSPEKENYYALGTCHEKQGNFQDAEKTYRIVQAAVPNLMKPYYLLAMMHYTRGDTIMFKKATSEALTFEPKVRNREVIRMKLELQQLLLEID